MGRCGAAVSRLLSALPGRGRGASASAAGAGGAASPGVQRPSGLGFCRHLEIRAVRKILTLYESSSVWVLLRSIGRI